MENNGPAGTNFGFGIRPEVKSIIARTLESRKAGLIDQICRGRANGAFMLSAWLMYQVSPTISGNYYLFDYAGAFPRRQNANGFSRSGLRNRLEWADKRAIITLHPSRKFDVEDAFVDLKRTEPANSSKDLSIRPWDIPLVAWENQILIPIHWRGLPVQIRREETYRLDAGFARTQLPNLLFLGRILRKALRGQTKMENYLTEPFKIWVRLKDALLKQYKTTRHHYEKTTLKRLDGAMRKSLKDEAKAAFLAFSIVDFRPEHRI